MKTLFVVRDTRPALPDLKKVWVIAVVRPDRLGYLLHHTETEAMDGWPAIHAIGDFTVDYVKHLWKKHRTAFRRTRKFASKYLNILETK